MRRLIALGVLAAILAGCKESPTEQPWGGATVPSLGIGQVFAVPNRTNQIRVEGGSAGAEYTLVPFAGTAAGSVTLLVSATGVQAAAGPPNPFLGETLSLHGVLGAERALASDYPNDFKRRLRQQERELTALIRPGYAEGAPLLHTNRLLSTVVPAPGDLLQFNANLRENCANPENRTGRVVAVSQRAIVVADTANPRGPGTFTDDEYRGFAQSFDQLIWPMAVQNFGEPQDVDNNQRVIIFFTRAVNELTPRGQTWYVGGAFFSRDLFPRTSTGGLQACAASNYAEMFYMLVPDPAGVAGSPRTKDAELRNSVTVIAHEFQHLINASRRLYVVRAGANWNEEVWLNEGLSHIAEELLGYAASSLAPRQNIDGNRLAASQSEQKAFFDHQYANITRLARYLQEPDTASLIGPDNLATRGATWLFLRYAADRRVGTGGAESPFWRGLVDSNTSGLNNLRSSLGSEPMDWINDWLVSVYADDAVPGVDPRFTQPSWNLRSIYPRLQSSTGAPLYGRYPLKTRNLTGTTESIALRAGTAAYLRFAVAPGSSAEITVQSTGGATPDPNVRFNIVRTR
jgi:hypothetical protein